MASESDASELYSSLVKWVREDLIVLIPKITPIVPLYNTITSIATNLYQEYTLAYTCSYSMMVEDTIVSSFVPFKSENQMPIPRKV